MPTLFSTRNVGASSPLKDEYQGSPVSPSDSADLPAGPGGPVNVRCIGLYVAGAGNVAVQLPTGGTATLTGLAAGQIVDIAVSRVLATGTTATGIQALYALRG